MGACIKPGAITGFGAFPAPYLAHGGASAACRESTLAPHRVGCVRPPGPGGCPARDAPQGSPYGHGGVRLHDPYVPRAHGRFLVGVAAQCAHRCDGGTMKPAEPAVSFSRGAGDAVLSLGPGYPGPTCFRRLRRCDPPPSAPSVYALSFPSRTCRAKTPRR